MPPFSRCTSTARPWQTVLFAAILAFPAFPQLRASGAAFAREFLTTVDEIKANSAPTAHELPLAEVPRWEMHELTAAGRSHVSNPFRDAALVGEFVSPSGRTKVVDGFYDGDDLWRLRFAPDEEGLWTFLLRLITCA